MAGFNPSPHPGLYQKFPEVYMSMGETAENVAKKYGISRKDQDEFAVLSQQHLVAAPRQPPRQHVAIHLVVLDQQDPRHGSSLSALASRAAWCIPAIE